jgi:hypothetical protein
MVDWAQIHLDEARGAWWRAKYEYRKRQLDTWEARVNLSKKLKHPDAQHNAEGEVRKWGPLAGEAAREVHKYAEAVARLKPKPVGPTGEGWTVPQTVWNPYRRKIANWITRELIWAHEHGWNGVITSGIRTYAEQKVLYERYLNGGNIAAPPGQSNHEGYDYTRGAIDTPEAAQLNAVLDKNPHRKLLWAETHGLNDFVHFSGTGR